MPIPFSYRRKCGDSKMGSLLFIFETKETSHYISHFFHLLEHVVGLWVYYGDKYFQDVHTIVLTSDQENTERFIWEGPNQINRHLLCALFPKAKVITWGEYLESHIHFSKSVTSDRKDSFHSPECIHLNKMLGAARRTLSKRALLRLSNRVHDYVGTNFQKNDSLRVTYLKRPPPRMLDPEVEKNLLFRIENHKNISLQSLDFAHLSFQKQIEIIGNTDILIGVHGNGLSHLLFLPPHAKIIEIFPPNAHALDYRLFADVRGLNYTGVVPGIGILPSRDAYKLGPFGNIDETIYRLDIPLILEAIAK
jgi:hypothetical protein